MSNNNTVTTQVPVKKKKIKTVYKVLLSILVVLIIARIALPYVVLHFINKELTTLKGYYGHVDDVDIALYRGAYQIDRIKLQKVETTDTTDFLYIKYVDLAIEWKPIFKGSIVGKVLIDSSTIQITQEKNDVKDISKDTADFRKVLQDLMPITVNRFEMKNSVIKYKDPTSKPKLDMAVTNIDLVILNLANAYDSTKVLPATADMTARIYEGDFKVNVKLDPYADKPKFDMNVSLKNTNLVLLNDFLKVYANVDVNKGNFGLYSEVAAKEGKFDGYVKPIIKDLDIVSFNKEEGNLPQIAWESLIGSVAWVVTNHNKDQLATKVYLEGSFKEPDIKIGRAIVTVLQNAFIKALRPNIDGEINISSVGINDKEKKGFFNKLFNKKDKKDGDDKDNKKEKRKDKKHKKDKKK